MRENKMKMRGCSRGMSLVELLVVMAILSGVMLAVMSLYVPVHQSTVAQTQVSDVNANLRLALRVMTQDLLSAGFLVPVSPVVFPDAVGTGPLNDYHDNNVSDIGTTNSSDFIIRTRIVGNDFARVSNVTDLGAGVFRLTLSENDMALNFPENSRVRLFESISSNELKMGEETDVKRAYPVVAPPGSNTITINTSAVPSITSITDIPAETVVVRIKDENQPPLQTIRYRHVDGSLVRVVNDASQVLARNVDTVDFQYFPAGGDRINHIEIILTGKTKALKNDAISGAKTRQINTSVKLRNIN
ncbi:MAG: prepilin-type N-terminal cleavage/methylation domain-containing protein [Gammaproteobacteria bacterium]|nr:MAG: prepilin-type N-terminal cleavage/methylation domain-containing protein [Gammaproteobacteria bacterium]